MQTRMNVVRLGDGALLVHSPTPVDDLLAAEIAALGSVAHVIALNCYHHPHAAPAPDALAWRWRPTVRRAGVVALWT